MRTQAGRQNATGHHQLCHWFEEKLSASTQGSIPASNLTQGLRTVETTGDLLWPPSRGGIKGSEFAAPIRQENVNGKNPSTGTNGAGGNAGSQTCTPNAAHIVAFTANTPFAAIVRSRSIAEAIRVAGETGPKVQQDGALVTPCLSWHCIGTCFTNCDRNANYTPMEAQDKAPFLGWRQRAFAQGIGKRRSRSRTTAA